MSQQRLYYNEAEGLPWRYAAYGPEASSDEKRFSVQRLHLETGQTSEFDMLVLNENHIYRLVNMWNWDTHWKYRVID